MILHRTEIDFDKRHAYDSPMRRKQLNPEYWVVHNAEVIKISAEDVKSFIQQATEMLVADGHYESMNAPPIGYM